MNRDAGYDDLPNAAANIETLFDCAEEQVSRAEKPARSSCLLPGFPDTLPGYSVVRRIKSGGQGVVYEAVHEATTRTVAIKLANAPARNDTTRLLRLWILPFLFPASAAQPSGASWKTNAKEH